MARRPLEPGTSEAQPAKRRPRRQLQPEVGAGSTGRDGGRLPEVFEPSDLWRFMCHFGHRLKHNVYGVDFLHVLIIVLCVGCDMVTDFSGLGAPEIAGHKIVEYLRGHLSGGQEISFKFLRASDVLPVCRAALALHGCSLCAPQCIMGDQLSRVPEALLSKAESYWQAGLEYAAARIEDGEPAKSVYSEIGQDLFNRCAAEFLDTSSPWITSAFCYVHGKRCAVQRASAALRGVVGGVLCYDWSNRGLKKGLLAFKSSMLLLTFMRDRLEYQEYFALIECVPGFDHTVFRFIEHIYELRWLVICTSVFGVPATRKRKIMFLIKKTTLRWHRAITTNNFADAFHHLFSIDGHFSSQIYFCAPRAAVDKYVQRHFSLSKLVSSSSSSSVT